MIFTDQGVVTDLNMGARVRGSAPNKVFGFGILIPLPRAESYGNHIHMPWNYAYIGRACREHP